MCMEEIYARIELTAAAGAIDTIVVWLKALPDGLALGAGIHTNHPQVVCVEPDKTALGEGTDRVSDDGDWRREDES